MERGVSERACEGARHVRGGERSEWACEGKRDRSGGQCEGSGGERREGDVREGERGKE